jgi:hypothetical protein
MVLVTDKFMDSSGPRSPQNVEKVYLGLQCKHHDSIRISTENSHCKTQHPPNSDRNFTHNFMTFLTVL